MTVIDDNHVDAAAELLAVTVDADANSDAAAVPSGGRAERRRAEASAATSPARRAAWRLSTAQTMILGGALVLSVIAAWFALYLLVLSSAIESHAQTSLYNNFRENLAAATVPLGGDIDPGTPVALLDFPPAGVSNLVVVEGTSSGDLMSGPGHRPDTVLPGQVGISVLYGRGMTFGGPFRNLGAAEKGTTLTVTTGQGVFTYKVEDVRREGDPLPAVLAVGGSRLTLVSSVSGSSGLSRFAPAAVVYLDAQLVGKAQAHGARPATVPQSEKVMQGDPSVLPQVMIWLEALLLSIGAGIWAWYKWGKPQTWLAAGGVALAALWALSAAVATLLPNLV